MNVDGGLLNERLKICKAAVLQIFLGYAKSMARTFAFFFGVGSALSLPQTDLVHGLTNNCFSLNEFNHLLIVRPFPSRLNWKYCLNIRCAAAQLQNRYSRNNFQQRNTILSSPALHDEQTKWEIIKKNTARALMHYFVLREYYALHPVGL